VSGPAAQAVVAGLAPTQLETTIWTNACSEDTDPYPWPDGCASAGLLTAHRSMSEGNADHHRSLHDRRRSFRARDGSMHPRCIPRPFPKDKLSWAAGL